MMIDMPLAEMRNYKPHSTAQDDFQQFWQQTLAESDAQPLNVTLEEYEYPVDRVTVYQVRYDGFGKGTRIAGWYIVPKEGYRIEQDGRTPTIVQYHGYHYYLGSKGRPGQYLHWALQGFNVLAVDTRGQNGDTPDNNQYATGAVIGCMTKGILDPQNYFYRFAYMDCVRAIDFLRTRPEVGPIMVMGGSQGGALALAVAALGRDKGIVAAMSNVPYLSDFRRSVEIFTEGPYSELVNYWKHYPQRVEESFDTLSYFDCMNLALMITCPVLMSVGLLDSICPPSTAFAVYNHLTCDKEIKIYPYNQHEGGSVNQDEEQYHFARRFVVSD